MKLNQSWRLLALLAVIATGAGCAVAAGPGTQALSMADSKQPKNCKPSSTVVTEPVPGDPSSRRPVQDEVEHALEECQCYVLEPDLQILKVNDPQVCTSNAACVSEVLVDATPGPQGQPCTARWQKSEFDVKKGKQPRLVWNLSGDTSKYRFYAEPNDKKFRGGIGLCKQSKSSEQLDLKDGRCTDASCKAFEWQAINMRARERNDRRAPHDGDAAIHFGIVVYELSSGRICHATDPAIIVRGQ